MIEAAPAARFVLAVMFLVAGASKLSSRSRFGEALHLSGTIPSHLVPLVRMALPPFEIAVGAFLLTGFAHPAGPVLAGLALLGFTAAVWTPAVSGEGVPCGCFGVGRDLLDRGTIARNGVLTGYALFATFAGGDAGARSVLDSYVVGAGPAPAAAWIDTVALSLFPFAIGGVFGIWQRATTVLMGPAPWTA
jgi:uncharacterized membrane protein YphA (DoxX/SURF4 family)